MADNIDKYFMTEAINIAKDAVGKTGNNPAVGCVIACDDKILAKACTAESGRPHAEYLAIQQLNDNEKDNLNFYVTLEPCHHIGHTPACVDEIIALSPKNIFIACQDPDDRTNGKSIEKLKAANINVITNFMQDEAEDIIKGFIKNKIQKLPYVTFKIATSLDGKIATKSGDSKWISDQESRDFVQHLRLLNDAILIGTNTFINDRPRLNCRIECCEKFSPTPIILNNNNNIKNEEIIEFAEDREIILVLNDQIKIDYLHNNIKIVKAKTDPQGFVLIDMLKKIANLGVNNILLEGGQQLATSFLQQDMIDEIIWITAPKIIGNDGMAAIGELNFNNMSEIYNFNVTKISHNNHDITFFLNKNYLKLKL